MNGRFYRHDCGHRTIPAPEQAAPPETYVASSTSLGFDVQRAEGGQWIATHTHNGKTATFGIALHRGGQGKFFAMPGSDASEFLPLLQQALQSTKGTSPIVRRKEVSFTFLVLGERQSRVPGRCFLSEPPGNWFVTKLYLGKQSHEVYLNLNSAIGKAEFASKDPGHGDGVLQALAPVL